MGEDAAVAGGVRRMSLSRSHGTPEGPARSASGTREPEALATFFTGPTIPFLIGYRFARVSPRLQTVPELVAGTGVVLVLWIGLLVFVRRKFGADNHDGWTDGLLASIRATIVFGICFLAVAVLGMFTLYL